jgi:hypothetical protein
LYFCHTSFSRIDTLRLVRLYFAVAVLSCFISRQLLAQDSLTVIPGAEYEAGGLHKLFFGSGWRDLWTIPIHVEEVDLSSYGGGLRATTRESYSLRFRAANGKGFIFRPIHKDPRLVLDPIIRQSLTDDIANDLIASTNPVLEFVTAPLLDIGGVYNAYYTLVRLPNDARLGGFREEFKGIVGMLGEAPLEVDPLEEAYMFADTYELFERFDANNNEFVDAHVYLKNRLMDVFFGNWDLGVNQLRWAGYNNHGQWIWTLFPPERNQAFSRYNGLVGWILSQQVPQIESFSDSYPWISDLTWSGRHVDRRLLSGIDRHTWDSVATNVSQFLNDEVIDEAVRKVPPEMYEKEGENLARALKSRRDKFKEASQEYYENLARFVDIWASDKNEYGDVQRIGNDTVIVSLYKRDKNTGGASGKPFFTRTFDRNETKEIRLYLQGGEDFTVVRGNATGSIPIRIVGGDGEDELADSSQVKGLLGSRTATYFYESDSKAEFIYGPSTHVESDDFTRPAEDSLQYQPLYRDWGHAWKGFPWLGLNSDDGLFLGGIARLTNYGFRAIPYRDEATFRLGYAFGPNRFRAVVEHAFPNVYTGTVNLYAHASGLEAVNFFGYGNNTSYSKALAAKDIYEVQQMQYALLPSYSIDLVENVTMRGHIGLRLINNNIESLADSAVLRVVAPYGVQDALYSSFGISGTYDSRDNKIATQHGAYFTLGTRWNPEIFDNVYAYTKAYTEFRGFYTAPVLGGLTLAVRARGEKIFGNRFPFYDAAFLGGIRDLRGFARERFAGDAAVLATGELRFNFGKFFIITPGSYGIHAFAEEGRVFYDGEISEARHGSFGGGIWIAPLSAENTVALTLAKSPEQVTFALTGGFAF